MRTAGQGPGGFEKRDGFMNPGQDLVMAGFTGLAGTRRIGQYKREELEAHFSPMFLRCLDQAEDISVKQWMECGDRTGLLPCVVLRICRRGRRVSCPLEFIRDF